MANQVYSHQENPFVAPTVGKEKSARLFLLTAKSGNWRSW
jgi:hypothetical protein